MQGSTELREKLALACRLLFVEGLIDHAGLVGARIPESGNLLLIPREMRGTSGRHPGIMSAGDFVVVDPEGRRIEGTNNPPSETPIFTGAFKARPDVMAVFHLHMPVATVFSMIGQPLRPVYALGAVFGDAVPVHPDGTLIQRPEQGGALAATLGDRKAVLLKGHGAVIVGASIEEAFVATIMLEDNAKRLFQAMTIGSPSFLEGDEMAEAARQCWQPKVISKIWTYHLMKTPHAGHDLTLNR